MRVWLRLSLWMWLPKLKNIATNLILPQDYTADVHMFRDVWVSECRPHHTKEELAFLAKLREAQSVQPKVKARSFREFSSKIVQMEYSGESGKCCLRGHDADQFLPEFFRRDQATK